MSETSEQEPKKLQTLSSFLWSVMRRLMWTFFTVLIVAVIFFITVPLVPFPASEHSLIRAQGPETLVGDWGNNHYQESYALFLDGKEIARVGGIEFNWWTFASQIRFHLKSPFYQKDSTGICRIVYSRTSWVEPFVSSCTPVTSPAENEKIQKAFTDGHEKFMHDAQVAKAIYEKYRIFGLVE